MVWRAREVGAGAGYAFDVAITVREPTSTGFVARTTLPRHPHVLTPRWCSPDGRFEVCDLVRGGSLAALRAHGALSDQVVRCLLDQVLQALGALHAVGLVHGDIKPSNLLLDPTETRPRLRVADFDTLCFAGPSAPGLPGSSTAGTRAFLAPERRAGLPVLPAHDVYAAGVTARAVGRRRAGPLDTVLDAMTRVDAARRPSPVEALDRLRSLPAAPPAPWPVVPDRFADPGGRRWRWPWRWR